MIDFDEKTLTGLYLLLRENEDNLDDTMYTLYRRIEKVIFEKFSVGEIERLDQIYRGMM